LVQESGILYGVNKSNNSLVILDRFTLHNANSIVFAQSGSGKSYTTKVEILRQLMQGTKVLVIDPEREYKRLSETVRRHLH
jgi:conjugal transfer ATP-binding protein TraC